MNQSCCSLGLSLKTLFGRSLHFMGIRVFIVGYKKEYKKSFFNKTGYTDESLATGMSHEFQSLDNKMAKLYFCPIVIQLS